MKYEDLMKKLENLKTPEIELPGHKRALRMALLNSGRFKERTIMDWAKMLAPVTAALLLIAVAGFFTAIQPDRAHLGGNEINKFASYQELQQFVKTNARYKQFFWGFFRGDVSLYSESIEGFRPAPSVPAPSDNDYSATNIQVAGVDEADIVKTDGEYIYVVSGQKVIIVKAHPAAEAQVLSEIKLEGTPAGIFINGDRLVVVVEEMPFYGIWRGPLEGRIYMPYISPKISVKLYDVSDRENPELEREISTNGQYVSSRMIGDYAYLVINEPVYQQDDEVNLPKISIDNEEKKIAAEDIWYSDVADYYYMYTTIIAINTQNDAQEPAYETMLLGASSNLYVSPDNIYLTFPVWGGDVGDFQRTSIHRIQVESDQMEYVASGEIPGMVLNQFSMDQYDGYFRVATTVHGETSKNNIYILDMELNIVGSLENLAPGEIIYSARFMGERCYLVTFMTTDPLFVIDLSNPYAPEVLGYLKIPGYSNYLHPYDENHIIGIGKEAVAAEEGNFAWHQGVKIALFDVSDVNNPREVGEPIVIGDRGTDSPVLWDHKAFLLHKARSLMVIPVLEAKINPAQYPEGVPPWAYGEPVWQGAYVFHISPDVGLRLEGKITHIDSPQDMAQGYYYYDYAFSVTRSLYIEDVLYTISQAKIKMHNLDNLDYINEVKLPYETWMPSDYLPDKPRSDDPSSGAESGGEKLPE